MKKITKEFALVLLVAIFVFSGGVIRFFFSQESISKSFRCKFLHAADSRAEDDDFGARETSRRY
jgi:hypothetical protein